MDERKDNDIFRDSPDDDRPVSRGEMRQIVRDIRTDIKWAVVIVVVAGQTIGHLDIPPIAGFIGGAGVIGLGLIKLAAARHA